MLRHITFLNTARGGSRPLGPDDKAGAVLGNGLEAPPPPSPGGVAPSPWRTETPPPAPAGPATASGPHSRPHAEPPLPGERRAARSGRAGHAGALYLTHV